MSDQSPLEERFSGLVYGAIQDSSNNTDRSKQQQSFRLGVSNIGHCRQYAKYITEQREFTDVRDKTAAFYGTVLGDAIETQLAKDYPDWLYQHSTVFEIPSGGQIAGHPDVVIPASAATEEHPQGVLDLKGLALDTPLPTPTGWTTMGEVQVGDELIDMHGNPTTVTAKSEVKNLRCYEVEVNLKEKIVCDENHLWWTRSQATGRLSVKRVDTMLSARKPQQIPLAGALDLPPVEVPVDPWVLGYWLGNGQRLTGVVTAHADDAEHVRALALAAGYDSGVDYSRKDGRKSETFSLFGLVAHLAEAGVSEEKRIPEEYLRGSIEQRKALLAGLLDSDGSWNRARRRVTFAVTDEGLRDGVAELARSLGQRVQTNSHVGYGFGRDVTVYSAEFRPTFNPFQIARKRALWEEPTGKPRRWHNVRGQEVDSVPTQCVQVDSPTSSFLCGRGMVPTHNSKAELDTVRRIGRTQQQDFQLTMYAKACIDEGLLDPTEPIYLTNVFFDRAAKGGGMMPYSITTEYDERTLETIDEWIGDVKYAVVHDQDASRDLPREFCAAYCEYFTTCRSEDTDAEGLLTDPEVLAAVDMYREGGAMEREGRRLKDSAKVTLKGVSGSTGEFVVRPVEVGPAEMKAYTRAGFTKLDIRPVPKGKR